MRSYLKILIISSVGNFCDCFIQTDDVNNIGTDFLFKLELLHVN